MAVSVADLLNYEYYRDFQLLAGKSGLTRQVTGCGILDYELDRDVNGKYAHANFLPNQLVISSLLFAKDNPFMLNDVVKYLIGKECSGLVIKNVFQLPIHDSVLRYADAKGFPILLADRKKTFFEDFIICTNDFIKASEQSERVEKDLSQLLFGLNSPSERAQIAHRLLTLMRSQYVAAYISFDKERRHISLKPEWFPKEMVFVRYRFVNGYFLLLTQDALDPGHADFLRIFQSLLSKYDDVRIGVSRVHFLPEDLRSALYEAVYASVIRKLSLQYDIPSDRPYVRYEDIGIYQVLLPLRDDEAMQKFTEKIIEPIIEFDAKNQGNLLYTLLRYVLFDGNLHILAEKTGQHENTLRFRLSKIADITGLNYRLPSDYEQLSLASRIYMLSDFRII